MRKQVKQTVCVNVYRLATGETLTILQSRMREIFFFYANLERDYAGAQSIGSNSHCDWHA